MEEYPITELRIMLNDKVVSRDRFFQLVDIVKHIPELMNESKKNR